MVAIPAKSVDGLRAISATVLERKASKYDSRNIQAALEALHQDGCVILKSVVDVTHIEHVNSFMETEAQELMRNNSKPFNQGVDCTRHHHFL